MPARFLLIDGYNLLYAAGMAQVEYAKGDLQRCRGRLLRFLLSKLTTAEIARATVVFDARDPPKDFPSHFSVSGLRVMFANPGGDADVAIENLIEDHSSPKSLTLVSSDRRLQSAARRRRAQSIASEQFYDDLERRERRKSEAVLSDPKFSGGMSEAQVRYWLQFFGEIPEAGKLTRPSDKVRPTDTPHPSNKTGPSNKTVPSSKNAPSNKAVSANKTHPSGKIVPPKKQAVDQHSAELERLLIELEEEGF